jgi:hypothetical protein
MLDNSKTRTPANSIALRILFPAINSLSKTDHTPENILASPQYSLSSQRCPVFAHLLWWGRSSIGSWFRWERWGLGIKLKYRLMMASLHTRQLHSPYSNNLKWNILFAGFCLWNGVQYKGLYWKLSIKGQKELVQIHILSCWLKNSGQFEAIASFYFSQRAHLKVS